MNLEQQFWPIADTRFPWLTSDQVQRLEQLTSWLTWMQKIQAQGQLYQQAIQQINNQKQQENRFQAENEMYCRSLLKSDPKQTQFDQCNVRLEQLADLVKDKYWLDANSNTNDIINWVVKMAQDKKVDINLLDKYLSDWDRSFLYEMGFEAEPVADNKQYSWFATHPDEVEEFWVWVLQSPWKWWYNLVWQWLDRLMEYWAEKLQGSDLHKWVRQKAVDLLWEDEVNAYTEWRQNSLNDWTAFKGREATDIRTPILWEERANTDAVNAWEFVWDIWTAIAVSYPMASALLPYMWFNTASMWARTLALWSIEWAIDWALFDLWSEWELHPERTALNMWIGWTASWSPELLDWFLKKWDQLTTFFKNRMNKVAQEEYKTLFEKWVKPSSAWIKSTTAQEKIYDNWLDAVESIVHNKENLVFRWPNWEEIVWKLPKNNSEFAQAIQQTKQSIYNQYNNILKQSWKDVRISTKELKDELNKLLKDKTALLGNESMERSIKSWLKWLEEIEDLPVEAAQKKIQEINTKLDAFYRNPNPNEMGANWVDALVKNKLAEEIDNVIEEWLWSSKQYRLLKKAYSALKSIEKDVNHRAIVTWRQSPNSLVDSIADISTVDSLLDILSWNPIWAVKAIWKQALKRVIKERNSSDNAIRKLFEKAEDTLNKWWSLRIRQQVQEMEQNAYQNAMNKVNQLNDQYGVQWEKNLNRASLIEWESQQITDDLWNPINPQKSLETAQNSEYNWSNLNSNQLDNGYNWTQWTRETEYWSNWWRDQGILEDTSMTNWGASKGWNWTSQQFVRISDWDEMVKLSSDLQSRSSRWLFMEVHDADHYNKSINIVSPNKDAAIIVTPEKVWKNIWNFIKADDAPKWIGKDLMMQAIEEWWNKMDNFWRFLTKYYENFWFKPVARVKFNREYAPKGWNYARDWEPDLFVMMHNWDSPEAVKANYWTYKHMTDDELKSLPEMEYDDALAYRDDLIEFSNKTQKDLKTSEDVLKYSKANKDAILEQYREKKWNYVNPDDFRDFINDEDRLLASETQDWASWLAEQYFDKLIKENKNGKGLIIAWWPWGWKWTSIGKLWDEWVIDTKWAAIIVDKTKWTKELKKMLDNWMTVEWDVVVPNADWIVDNIIWRTVNQNVKKWFWKWRTLPINWYWIPTHKEVAQIAKDLYNESKNSKDFIVRFIDNTWKKEDINIKDWVEWIKLIEEFQWKLENITEWSVKKSVDEAYKKWDITKKQRDDMIKSITSILFVWWLLYWANEES